MNIKSRELASRGLTWKETLHTDDQDWWKEWIESLSPMREIENPLCLFSNEFIVNSELHIFNDATEEASASVIYLGNILLANRVVVRLLMEKTSQRRRRFYLASMGTRLTPYVTKSLRLDPSTEQDSGSIVRA